MKNLSIVTYIAILFSSSAIAIPFSSIDPRSMAMGGAGVASPDPATAPYFNPALLSNANKDDNFALELPIVGARVYDPEDFVDNIDIVQNNITSAQNAMSQLDVSLNATTDVSAQTSSSFRTVASLIDSINGPTGLPLLDNKPVGVEAGAAIVVAIPGDNYSGALTIGGDVYASVEFDYITADAGSLNTLSTQLNATAVCADDININGSAATACAGNSLIAINGTALDTSQLNAVSDITLTSEVNIKIAAITEVGVSLAKKFQNDSFSVGITPKVTTTTLYFDRASAETSNEDTADSDANKAEYNDFNIDVGVAKNLDDGILIGATIKNVISKSYAFKNNGINVVGVKNFELKPMARVGVSMERDWYKLLADLDITKNDNIDGVTQSQYLALGTELDLFKTAQLRLGYRADLENSDRSTYSVGFGFSPFGVHIDIGAAASDNEIAAAFQLGFRF